MNLCNDRHDEVCYEGRDCPVCDMRNEKQVEIDDLNEKLEEAE